MTTAHGKIFAGEKLPNLENHELFCQNFPCQIFTDTPKMYLAYALTVAYSLNFSSPIAFTCVVNQKFPPTKIFPCTVLAKLPNNPDSKAVSYDIMKCTLGPYLISAL